MLRVAPRAPIMWHTADMTNPEEVEEVDANTTEHPDVQGDEALDAVSGGRPVFVERPGWKSRGHTYLDGERL